MSAKHAVLGLLLQQPSYPYELSLLFDERIGPAWAMNRGQVYQMVYRLEEEGLVERVGNKPNARGPRWIYKATPQGEEEFDHWFLSRAEKVRPHRDDLILKVALSRPKHADHLLEAVARQEQICMQRLAEYSELETTLASLKASGHWDDVWRFLIVKAAAAHLHTDIDWLREVRETLEDFSVRGDARAPTRRRRHRQAN